MSTQGWITIGTRLNNSRLDRQMQNLERRIQRAENRRLTIQVELSNQEAELHRVRNETDQLADAYQRVSRIQQRLNQGGLMPHQDAALRGRLQALQQQYGTLQQIENSFNRSLNRQNQISSTVMRLRNQYQQINQDIAFMQNQLNNIRTNRISQGFNRVSDNVSKAIKKVTSLALTIFTLRTAIVGLNRLSGNLTTYDKQYAANLEYIRYVLTQAIAPVLKFIVQLAMRLLQLINLILNALFGINIFGNASADSFKRMKNNANGVGKAVKEIKKQLMGFDEINMLNDQTDSSGGGVGSLPFPSMDLSVLDGDIPDWMRWLVDNKDLLLSLLLGIAGALIAIKFGASGILALGIGLLIAGIVEAIQGLLDYLKDSSWNNFGKIIIGIGLAILGLGVIIGAFPVVVAGAIVAVLGIIIKYWDKIKAFLQKGIDWLYGKSDWVHEMFGDVLGSIYDTVVDTINMVFKVFDAWVRMVKKIFDGIIEFIKGVFTGNWEQAWNGISKIFSSYFEGIKEMAYAILEWFYNKIMYTKDTILAIVNTIWEVIKSTINIISEFFKGMWDGFVSGAWQAWEGIKSIFSNLADFLKYTFKNAWQAVKDVFSVGGQIFDGIKDGIVNAFKTVVNAIITGINKVVSVPFNSLNNILWKLKNIEILGLKPFNWVYTFKVPQLPYLKTGGIINMPNKGTMIGGSAIGGESGRERSHSINRPTSNGRIRCRNRKKCCCKLN